MTRARYKILGLLPLLVVTPVAAQVEAPPSEPPAVRFQDVPYEAELVRLLEVLGAIQFLRQLCDEDELDSWRSRAAELIAAEGDTENRKQRFTAAFNRGYKAFSSYTRCTQSAVFAIDGYMREGEALSRSIVVRYGE